MAVKGDILVFDSEYNNAGDVLSAYCDALVNLIESYNNMIDVVLETAIKDEIITNHLKDTCQKMGSVKETLMSMGLTLKNNCKGYVTDIDNADDFLY